MDSKAVGEKARTPAIIGSAALAGLVGGWALARNGGSRRVLGVKLPGPVAPGSAATQNVAEAARQVGLFGERVGELAHEVRLVREGIAHSHRRSPVEVVLEGLTTRRG